MSVMIQGCRHSVTVAALLLLGIGNAWSTAPVIYSQVANESPVRGDPGDLLFLGGYGFATTDTVVYQAIMDTTQPLAHPASVPTSSSATSGIAPVMTSADVPNSLTVMLPSLMTADQSYALWILDAAGEWSNGIRINDARPLWVTPDSAYATAQLASLPRSLKVVGRNLQPASGAQTQVKLVGPTTYMLVAANDNNPATATKRYVAQVSLPNTMVPGNYSVQVSRDGVSWVSLAGKTVSVLSDPVAPKTFPVSDPAYGGCVANDGLDDTACIAKAIAAAKNNGGGTVTFGAGVWDMNYTGTVGDTQPVTADGVLVPVGVNLQGAGSTSTTISRGTSWPAPQPNFTLQGGNSVSGIRFGDANIYSASTKATGSILKLGVSWYWAQHYDATDPTLVSNVSITQNVFDKPFYAIADGGMPIDHLYVTYNEFGAFHMDLSINGDGKNTAETFRLDDSIVAFNTFKPGSYIDTSIGQGVIATGLNAGYHVDFSGNTADGTSTQYLYSPATDPKGWRAGFFWGMRGNVELTLVSQNTATCTGDKAGDGEGFSYDGNHNWNALPAAQSVSAATATTVTVPGPLQLQSGNQTFPGSYYTEYWVSVADGPGKGQVRKIISYPLDSSGAPITPITFTVTPAWDVIPQSTSRIVVTKEYWQVYTLDNNIDQRLTNDQGQPLCTKGNGNKPAGGVITLYGQTADSVAEGNVQHDTDGILLNGNYTVADSALGTVSLTVFQQFVDVRGNTVDREYQWASDCSWSGIQARYGAGTTAGSSPPPEGFGVSISHNAVTHADALHGGAISFATGGNEGPAGTNWNFIEGPLVFANTVNDVNPPDAGATSQFASCGTGGARYGINVSDSHVFNATLYGNACNSVTTPLNELGTGTQRICSALATNDACESQQCTVVLTGGIQPVAPPGRTKH